MTKYFLNRKNDEYDDFLGGWYTKIPGENGMGRWQSEYIAFLKFNASLMITGKSAL